MDPVALFTPEFREDPYPTYRILREHHPVYRDPQTGVWLLSRYDDVYGALADHETFSSENTRGADTRLGPRRSAKVLVGQDQPRHTRFRRLVNKPLARKEIKKLVPAIEELVNDLLDKATDQPIELVSALAVPLPVMIIARVLGVPPEDYQRFKAWSDAVVATDAPGPTTSAAVREMYAYFREVFASRRARPLDDLISVLIHTDEGDEPFDEEELLDICHVVLVAGNQTTLSLIGNLMNVLVDHPDVWTRLREDRSLVDLAIEEGLRFDSPLQLLWRRSVRDVMVRGVTIPEGSTVGVMYGSANRDDDEFLDADSFLLSRELGKHLAFGHGIHYCMGAPLAQTEIRAVLNGLLDRYASLERAEEPTKRLPTPGFTLRGFERLPIHFY
jgi:cytochrome P450